MCAGVESIRLGPRPGTSPLDFSITRFNHVRVPASALVSSDPTDLALPLAPLAAWWDEVWRIPLGTLAVTAPWISSLKAAAFIAGRYSAHRAILGKGSEPVPIIAFRTQQWPITHAVAVAHVLSAWYPRAAQMSADRSLDPRVRHALAVIVKTTACRQFQRCVPEVAERCGAQGTFEHNYMARIENDGKGVIIAEGDVMTLCIRLFSELVQQKYAVPLPDPESSILAAHANGVLQENIDMLQSFPGGHRDPAFDALVLPQAEASVEALGHALAYSAAAAAGLPQPLLDVYEAGVVRRDPAWYSENLAFARMRQRIREDAAVASAVPHLPAYLDALEIEPYVSAPIVSDAAWKAYFADMPVHTGSAPPPPDIVQAVL